MVSVCKETRKIAFSFAVIKLLISRDKNISHWDEGDAYDVEIVDYH